MSLAILDLLQIPNTYYTQALIKTNDETKANGLSLSEADAAQIVAFTDETLRNLGRIEMSSELIPLIIRSFSNSPYMLQDDYREIICQLLECFYYLKNESRDQISDDDLIAAMRVSFDQECFGVVELLADKLKPGLD